MKVALLLFFLLAALAIVAWFTGAIARHVEENKCSWCDGRGVRDDLPCQICDGSGTKPGAMDDEL